MLIRVLHSALLESGCAKGHVTPEVVRRHFKGAQKGLVHPSLNLEKNTLSDDESISAIEEKKRNVAFLLSYCISDIQATLCGPDSPLAEEASQYLYGLPLVPTEVVSYAYLDKQIFTNLMLKITGWLQLRSAAVSNRHSTICCF